MSRAARKAKLDAAPPRDLKLDALPESIVLLIRKLAEEEVRRALANEALGRAPPPAKP